MPTRDQIVSEARKHLGTRFHHQGRAPGAGLDCLGLVVVTARALGIEMLDRSDYHRDPDGVSLVREIGRSLDGPFNLSEKRIGSVILFQFLLDLPQHVAIYAGDNIIIHSIAVSPRKVCEMRLSDEWLKRAVSVWEFRGVTDR